MLLELSGTLSFGTNRLHYSLRYTVSPAFKYVKMAWVAVLGGAVAAQQDGVVLPRGDHRC